MLLGAHLLTCICKCRMSQFLRPVGNLHEHFQLPAVSTKLPKPQHDLLTCKGHLPETEYKTPAVLALWWQKTVQVFQHLHVTDHPLVILGFRLLVGPLAGAVGQTTR